VDQLVCLGHDQAAWSGPASISSETNTVAGKTEDRSPGSLIYEPFGLVHRWGNPGSEPLTFLAFNINPEGVPAVVPETPAQP
jgi:oxalate decarboxylase/phosphoglucose isomerase-like protein (cupin superfamily)